MEVQRSQHPLLLSFVKARFHGKFALLVRAEHDYIKVDIILERVHLSVAVQDMNLGPENIFDALRLLYEAHCLIVNDTVLYGFRVQEPPIYE